MRAAVAKRSAWQVTNVPGTPYFTGVARERAENASNRSVADKSQRRIGLRPVVELRATISLNDRDERSLAFFLLNRRSHHLEDIH
jgi:hypothetical protein